MHSDNPTMLRRISYYTICDTRKIPESCSEGMKITCGMHEVECHFKCVRHYAVLPPSTVIGRNELAVYFTGPAFQVPGDPREMGVHLDALTTADVSQALRDYFEPAAVDIIGRADTIAGPW